MVEKVSVLVVRALYIYALTTNPETFSTIRRITHDFWTEEKQPEEFSYERIGILPPKGDLSVPGNYRGIMMLEVGKNNLEHHENPPGATCGGTRPLITLWFPPKTRNS